MNTRYKNSLLLIFTMLILFTACDVVDNITGNKGTKNESTIHPVLVNGKWGYINTTGKVLVEGNIR